MANFAPVLSPALQDFIAQQRMFFTATAPSQGGRVNLSPKGLDSFRVLSESQVAYLDLTGSGNETAAHVLDNGRITIMFCSFDDKPLILRIYGRGEAVGPRHASWNDLTRHFTSIPGIRQIIRVDVESVQTSCGFGVPLYEFKGRREMLEQWAVKKGEDGLREYRDRKNRVSIDGLPTGIL